MENEEIVDEGGQLPPEGEEPSTSIKIGDEEVSLDEVNQWRDAHTRKSSWEKAYTQRDMTLAEQRKSLEKSSQIEEFLKKNPQLYSKIEALFKEHAAPAQQPQGQQPGGEHDSEIRERLNQLDERQAGIELEREIDDLRSTFKQYFDADKDLHKKVVKHALDSGITSLRMAFKDYMFDKVATDKLNEGLKGNQRTLQHGKDLSKPSGTSIKGKGVDLKGKSYNEIAEMMKDDPRMDAMLGNE